MPKRLRPFIPPSLRVVSVTSEPQHVTVLAVPRSLTACCSACRLRSDSVHGSYGRHLADLPWQGRSVGLHVRLRRLRCRNPACPRRTFSETPPDVAAPHARRSRRLHDLQRHFGLALGGAPAARLAYRLAIPASPSTFLRFVRAGPTPVALPPRVIAIDEWAWRRGCRYGTVIVDLERRVIADLLPDREIEVVAAWLRRHPRVEIIARDRAEVYSEAVRQGAPEAVHVLDRWHLLRNLGEALQEVVGGEHAVIHSVTRTLGDERAAALRIEQNRARPATASDRRKLARHAPRRARHAEVRRLHAPKLADAADLAVRFARMPRGQSSEPVTDWLAAARSSVLKRFAAGLQRDAAGIENVIALPWSTGPVEGEISRLMTIKRSMYGRAGFELLRQRVLNPV
ncbi:ISL3 family transposase [Methylobacterium dankookense]|uniref:Transposase IS204/IS1001/IS1096/IS1165 DDE domain-containing protein n=1 Tax=Methylobacterium dankookense TaxID=560405 RepID=A0A564G5P0_9HYPH|nr:ISL3 family transposase [Methylobacterium dankookense]GJD59043.1 hypothetical protein IFDJLNFL_4969 [Methylobacterium dankookense]VUF15863.1 hypothetical protein MTDSW087_05611 [Methylobacterium dankookense]